MVNILLKIISSKSKSIFVETPVKKGTYYYKIRSYNAVNKKMNIVISVNLNILRLNNSYYFSYNYLFNHFY